MKKYLSFTIIVWVLIFGVGEVGLRAYKYVKQTQKPESKFTFNQASVFVPHPSAVYVGNKEYKDHNAQGFRADKEAKYQEGQVDIVCLGGSSTYGTRVDKEHAYPQLLENVLRYSLNREVTVLNGGLAGYCTFNIIPFLSTRIVNLKPRIIIYYVGFNDAGIRMFYSGFKMDYSHALKQWEMPDFPIWRNSALLDIITTKLSYSSIKSNPHIDSIIRFEENGEVDENFRNSTGEAFRSNLKTLIGITRIHGSIPVFVTQATNIKNQPKEVYTEVLVLAMEEHTAIIKEVAAEMSVNLIDVRSKMTDINEYFVDILHKNAAGNQKRAEILAEYLIKKGLIGESKPLAIEAHE